jgi:branched-chain amino acid transport system permease protein
MHAVGRRYYAATAAFFSSLSFDQRMGAGLLMLFAVLPAAAAALLGGYALLVAERAAILAIAALSLELLVGAGGLLSFGHAAFLGIGAYAAGMLASHGLGTLSLALPAALLACAIFALMTGAVAVRTSGVYFIMITLAFGQMAFFIAASLAPYGGDDGLSYPSRTLVAGRQLLKAEPVFFYVTLACLALAYVAAHRLVGSRFGRVLRGLTDNELRMQAIGFAPYRYRLTLYVIAGTLCGLAGFLLGNQAEFVSPAYMHWQRSGELILMVLLGGSGTLYGPILGAVTFLVLEEVLSRLTEHWKVILGPLLILLVLFANGGIAGAIESWRRGQLGAAQARETLLHVVTATNAHLARGRGELERVAQRLAPCTRRAARALLLLRWHWRSMWAAFVGLVIALLLSIERWSRR